MFESQVRACEHIPQAPILFSSPQCFGYRSEYGPTTRESCFPSDDIIIKQLKRVVRNTKDVRSIFVASDNRHMLEELRKNFNQVRVRTIFYVILTLELLP